MRNRLSLASFLPSDDMMMTSYIALLRGVNAGKERRIDMKTLKLLLEHPGFTNVSTYINSGNILFTSDKPKSVLQTDMQAIIQKEFGFDVPVLIKTKKEMKKIADAIPFDWKNDSAQRTDVAYLFDAIDSKKVVKILPLNKAYADIRYVKGAVIWHMMRENYNKSRLNGIIKTDLYQLMTVRNVNTARFLAQN